MTGVIVCGGSINDYNYMVKYFKNTDLVICADGGAAHLRNFNITPDILIGDFDSISTEDYNTLVKAGVDIIKFDREKDMTDTQLAIELAVEKGCKTVILLGAIGTRLDHSISNVFLLKKLHDIGVKGIIANEHNEAVLINKSISLEKEEGIKVTLLPITEKVFGVTTKGLYYPLDNATIEFGSSWGVSNEFKDDIASVTMSGGLLLVIKSRD